MTSERGTVTAVEEGRLAVRFDDGRRDVLTADELGADRLDHAYAVTVHRMQGATVDRAHVLADGGGRELAYVAMSRARDETHLYVSADDVDQAVEDLIAELSVYRRQRWTLDVDQPADPGEPSRPNVARRTAHVVRMAQLRAERHAIAAVAPDASRRLEALDLGLRLKRLEVKR